MIQWDNEVSRFHVTLGSHSIGFHKSEEGASAIAAAHSRQSALPGTGRSWLVWAGIHSDEKPPQSD